MTHEEWIAYYVDEFTAAYSRELAEDMADAFPELRVVAGYAIVAGAPTAHWWCVTSEGTIVDPTRQKFTGNVTYREMGAGEQPLFRCWVCGRPSFTTKHTPCCSAVCKELLGNKKQTALVPYTLFE